MKVFLVLVLLAVVASTTGRSVDSDSAEDSSVVQLTDEDYKSVIKTTKGRVFVRFYSSW